MVAAVRGAYCPNSICFFSSTVGVFDNDIVEKVFGKLWLQVKVAVHLYKISIACKAKDIGCRVNHLLFYQPHIYLPAHTSAQFAAGQDIASADLCAPIKSTL